MKKLFSLLMALCLVVITTGCNTSKTESKVDEADSTTSSTDSTTDKDDSEIDEIDNTGVVQVSLGGNHSASITEDGSLWMWGYNLAGQLGNGTINDSENPIHIMDDVGSISLQS